jgi:3'-phosphoadenosine 5'-phosphosulfate sulfotransferase (PAPS reductase)/FAD synthetase
MKAEEILKTVREETDSVLLFSSIVGKDSILLTQLCSQVFKNVVVVYMFIVRDMEYIHKYQALFEKRFNNVKYLHLPHYVLGSYVKVGFMGIKTDESQKRYSLADIDKIARDQTGLSWSVYGMKKNDSMNRRLQLNTYKDGICHASNKVYPLMDYKNSQILNLIHLNRLPKPLSYGKGQSSGEDIQDKDYLDWLYRNYPSDLQKVFTAFPGTKLVFYESQVQRESN